MVWFFWLLWFYFTSQICHCRYASGHKTMKIIRNVVVSLQNIRLDEPLCFTVAEAVMSLYLEAVCFSSCGYSDPFSIEHETLMRHALMSFHILSWRFMLTCFTGRLLFFFFFLFYRMSQKSFPSAKLKLKPLLWSLIAYQLWLLSILLRIRQLICCRLEK